MITGVDLAKLVKESEDRDRKMLTVGIDKVCENAARDGKTSVDITINANRWKTAEQFFRRHVEAMGVESKVIEGDPNIVLQLSWGHLL